MVHFVLIVAAYFFMEFVAWSSHKYVMHGFLWNWHRDHHRKDHQKSLPLQTEDKRFEKNDLFFLIYATPAIVLLMIGISFNNFYLVSIGVGITLYGFTYFTIHDIVIHHRVKASFLFNVKNSYIRSIINAHTAHHWPKTKDDFHNYGLLIFPSRFFTK